MKIKKIEQKEVEHPKITINHYFGADQLSSVLSWTCPKCSGYGCNKHSPGPGCDDKQAIKSFSDLKNTFGEDAAEQFKAQMIKFFEN